MGVAELKTTQKADRSGADPLREFPQLAFAVVALSMGALGPGGAARVELEILRPGGAEATMGLPSEVGWVGSVMSHSSTVESPLATASRRPSDR